MTTRKRHARVKEIFAEACVRTATERGAYLRQACGGDVELLAEVESLLAFHDGAATEPHLEPSDQVPPTHLPAAGGMSDDEPPTLPSRAGAPADVSPLAVTLPSGLPPSGLPPSGRSMSVSRTPSTRMTGRFNPGEIFAQRYRIVGLLGIGGMGEVYQAHDEVLDVPVALKFITEADDTRRAQLLNEVRLARRVTHPSVCRVFDVSQVGQEYFITMEYVDGENLSSLLRRVGRFPSDKLLDLTHQLCAGLAAAHAKGVLHQDLKPANILLDEEGKVRITDFGIATTLDASERGRIMGTPAYMAPERLAGQPASAQSDLYALGLVLYEMASGRAVFEAKTPREYARLHQLARPEAPSSHIPDIAPRLESAILSCLEKDPRHRPASALDLAAALPGGDPLRLAMEAGDTPSPELVARAQGRDEGLHPGMASGLLVILAATLVAIFFLSGKAYELPTAETLLPPQVLAVKAREILLELGHEEIGAGDFSLVGLDAVEGSQDFDSAWGFYDELTSEGRVAVRFWYRQSPFPLVPSDKYRLVLDSPWVDFEDPPHLEEGMVQMVLDGEGRLILLDVMAAILEDDQPPAAETVDWDRALAAGGFDPAKVRPAAGPRRVPRMYAEERRAFTAPDPRDAEAEEVHIDTATHGGRVVYFSAWPHNPEDLDFESDLLSVVAGMLLFDVGLLLVVVAAVVMARFNLRHQRGDLVGARNLVFYVMGAKVLYWLLASAHVLDLNTEILTFHVTLGVALVEALLVWLAYIALEPTVRRYWPQTLISWNRLLRQRFRDPLVGRSLLAGAVTGACWALLRSVDRLAAVALELPPVPDGTALLQLELALNSRLPFASLLTSSLYAVYSGVVGLFLLAVLRVAARRTWLAMALFVVIQGLFECLMAGHPQIAWLTLGLPVAVSTAWILVRFGLLTYIAALFVENVLTGLPITSDLGAWFFGSGLFALVVPVVVAAVGAYHGLAGRSLIGEWMGAEPGAS